MNSLPEDIQLKIYKDVHGMAYSSVMDGIHKVGHKQEYTKVLKEVVFARLAELIRYGMPDDLDGDTIEGKINIRAGLLYRDVLDYIDMVGRFREEYTSDELRNKLNEIQSYDLYDITTDGALQLESDELDQQQTDSETESEPEPERTPERRPTRVRNTFRRYVPSAAENYMEEMNFQREVAEEHRMYTNLGIKKKDKK